MSTLYLIISLIANIAFVRGSVLLIKDAKKSKGFAKIIRIICAIIILSAAILPLLVTLYASITTGIPTN